MTTDRFEKIKKKAMARAKEAARRDPAGAQRLALLLRLYAAVTPIRSPEDMKRLALHVYSNSSDQGARRVAKIFLMFLGRNEVRMSEETCRATGFKNRGGEQESSRRLRKMREEGLAAIAREAKQRGELDMIGAAERVLRKYASAFVRDKTKRQPSNPKHAAEFAVYRGNRGRLPSANTIASDLKRQGFL